MAFSTKVEFIPTNEQEDSITFEFVEYGLVPINGRFLDLKENLFENFKSLNFAEIHDYFTDFVSELTFDEFLIFHANNLKSNDNQSINSFLIKNIHSGKYLKAIITIYEWESGY